MPNPGTDVKDTSTDFHLVPIGCFGERREQITALPLTHLTLFFHPWFPSKTFTRDK